MAKVKDPICGMTVDTEKAPARSEIGGQTVYFCSVSCKTRYEAAHKAG